MGADHVQGFLLGVPLDPSALPMWDIMATAMAD